MTLLWAFALPLVVKLQIGPGMAVVVLLEITRQ